MRKLVFLLFVSVILLALGGVVNAGSWWVEYGENSGQPGDSRTPAPSSFPQLTQPPWGNPNTPVGQGTPSPHLGFSTASNQCKTCHAVHLADASSYRLLHDISRMTECDWCHDASTGRSSHRPYGEMALRNKIIRGEHTLKTAVLVPDSSVNTAVWSAPTPPDKGRLPNRSVGDRTVSGNGLYCFDCHSVHGAGTLGSPSPWTGDILRVDPAGNGGNVQTDGLNAIEEPGKLDVPSAPSDEEVITAFCGDCHNINPNWTNPTDFRDNRRAHPINTNGALEVYNQVVTVSGLDVTSCRTCHSATDGDALRAGSGESDFPHQSQGHKLLRDIYTAAPTWGGTDGWGAIDSGDPQRPLPEMDFVCWQCHGGFIGITF